MSKYGMSASLVRMRDHSSEYAHSVFYGLFNKYIILLYLILCSNSLTTHVYSKWYSCKKSLNGPFYGDIFFFAKIPCATKVNYCPNENTIITLQFKRNPFLASNLVAFIFYLILSLMMRVVNPACLRTNNFSSRSQVNKYIYIIIIDSYLMDALLFMNC